jgi:mannose-6-phosphate isomerase-like protein (cupin superfamily)
MKISRHRDAKSNYEYGCDLRRLYPWSGVVNPLWGAAIASVRPGESTHPHSHDEEETFLIIRGAGIMKIGEESSHVEQGDMIYIPRNEQHTIKNISTEMRLEFLTIFWGGDEANERMINMVQEMMVRN